MSYSTGGINLTISAEAQKSIDTLKKLNTTLKELHTSLNNVSKVSGPTLGKVNEDTKKTVTSVKTLDTSFNKLGRTIKRLLTGVSVINIVRKSLKEILDYTENFNMFSVAMGTENIAKAMKFQSEITNALGSSQTDTMRMQGFFMALSESLGIVGDKAYTVSENLTKLSYDLSSLYNLPAQDMFSKLQSGLVGQTKPLRSVGIDVTQQTLQPYLKDMGINAMVTELTQAEKVVLRYIAIIKQSNLAHGDMALTLQNPANQIRILTAQLRELYRWLGATFIGLLGKILPYINGFVMALVQVVKTIATLFGFSVEDFDASKRSIDLGLDEEEEASSGIANNLGKASKNAKELKKQLAGFDEINNLSSTKQPETPSGGAGGIGSSGGQYLDTLLENLKGYDNLMGSVSSKATEIRDRIMEWLGFTQIIDDETGEITWKLGEGNTMFGNIVETVKNLALAFVGIKIGEGMLNVLGFFSSLSGGISSVLTPLNTFTSSLFASGGALNGLALPITLTIAGIVLFTTAIMQLWNENETFRNSMIGGWEAIVETLKNAWDNFILPVFESLQSLIKDVIDNTLSPLWETFKSVLGNIMIQFSSLWQAISPIVNLIVSALGVILPPIITALGTVFTTAFAIAGAGFKFLLEFFGNGFASIMEILSGIINFVTGVFTGNWSKAFNGLGQILSGIFNGIAAVVVAPVNFIIDVLNAFIRGLNKIQVPDWVPLIGGKGINIGEISRIGNPSLPSYSRVGNNSSGSVTNGKVVISGKANGGLVNSAELFFANENGNPEYIGKFGNKGAVANNDQIVDGISKGVYNAITEANKNNGSNQPMNITVPVNIGGTTVGTQLIRYLRKTQEETGEYILALD